MKTALITRHSTPRCSSASCMAMALMTVASMPMLSAATRSISWACSATPRKMLPPPTTTPISTPRECTSTISPVISATLAASRPKPRGPASTSPDSLRTIRLYIPFRVSHTGGCCTLANGKTSRAGSLLNVHFAGKLSHLLQPRPHLSEHCLSDLGACFFRGSCVEGRMRIVFVCKLYGLCKIFSEQDREQCESKVDSRRHSASGDPVSVNDDSLMHWHRAKERQKIPECPMGSRFVSAEQTGGSQQHGSAAHRGHILCPTSPIGKKIQKRSVLHCIGKARPSADEEYIEVFRAVFHAGGRLHCDA